MVSAMIRLLADSDTETVSYQGESTGAQRPGGASVGEVLPGDAVPRPVRVRDHRGELRAAEGPRVPVQHGHVADVAPAFRDVLSVPVVGDVFPEDRLLRRE